MADELQYTLFRLPRALLLLVPVRDDSAKVNSLHLLYEGADDLEVLVADGAYPIEIDVNEADDIAVRQTRVSFRVGIITDT